MTPSTSRALNVSVLCPSELCVALRKWRVQFTATLACIVLAFALGEWCAVEKPPLVDDGRPKVVIRGKEFFVLEHHPKNACGRLQYDKKLIEELDVKPGWGATDTSGLKSTRGHYALKQKYHLPLTPPHKLCVLCSNSAPNLCLPSNLVKKIFQNFSFFTQVKKFCKNILKEKHFLLGFTTCY